LEACTTCIKRILQFTAFTLALLSLSVHAANWEQGVHYFELAEPQPVQTDEKIEVRELFWYGCPHCYSLEPFLENWKQNKPEKAGFVLMPGIFNKASQFHARVFYTFESLDITKRVHRDFYDEIHQRGNRMRSPSAVAQFAAKHGVEDKAFEDAFNSFSVDANVRNARKMFRDYEATGVPTLIVDGRYRITVASAGGHEQLLQLINFLVEREAQARSE